MRKLPPGAEVGAGQLSERPCAATLADGTRREIGKGLTGRMTIAGQSKEVTDLMLPDYLDYTLIIEMDILRKLGLRLFIDDKPIYPITEKHPATRLQELEDQERAELDEIIRQEKARCENIKGPIQLMEYDIRLLDPRPIKQRYRPRNPAMHKVINDHDYEMLKTGVRALVKPLELSSSPGTEEERTVSVLCGLQKAERGYRERRLPPAPDKRYPGQAKGC
jgi:hypothetical protein